MSYGDKFYYIFIYIVTFNTLMYLKLNVSTIQNVKELQWILSVKNVFIYSERKSLINMEILNHKSTSVKQKRKPSTTHLFVKQFILISFLL